MKKTLLSVIAASGLIVGCMTERELPPSEEDLLTQDEMTVVDLPRTPPPTSNEYRPLVGQLPVQNGELDGSVGTVSGLVADSDYDTSGWGEPTYASIYTVGWGQDGAAMTIVELEGGLNHPDLQPGAHLEYNIYDTSGANDSLFAYVVGCAGEEQNEWTFDQVADETIVDVSAHPSDANVLIIDYEASFTDWQSGETSSVVGTFEVVRTPS